MSLFTSANRKTLNSIKCQSLLIYFTPSYQIPIGNQLGHRECYCSSQQPEDCRFRQTMLVVTPTLRVLRVSWPHTTTPKTILLVSDYFYMPTPLLKLWLGTLDVSSLHNRVSSYHRLQNQCIPQFFKIIFTHYALPVPFSSKCRWELNLYLIGIVVSLLISAIPKTMVSTLIPAALDYFYVVHSIPSFSWWTENLSGVPKRVFPILKIKDSNRIQVDFCYFYGTAFLSFIFHFLSNIANQLMNR